MNTISPVQHFIEQFAGCTPSVEVINPDYLAASMLFKIRTRNTEDDDLESWKLGGLDTIPMFKPEFVERAVGHVRNCSAVKLDKHEGPSLIYFLATFMQEFMENVRECQGYATDLKNSQWGETIDSILSNPKEPSLTRQLIANPIAFFFHVYDDTEGASLHELLLSEGHSGEPTGIIGKLLDSFDVPADSIENACYEIRTAKKGQGLSKETLDTIHTVLDGFSTLFAYIDLVSTPDFED